MLKLQTTEGIPKNKIEDINPNGLIFRLLKVFIFIIIDYLFRNVKPISQIEIFEFAVDILQFTNGYLVDCFIYLSFQLRLKT